MAPREVKTLLGVSLPALAFASLRTLLRVPMLSCRGRRKICSSPVLCRECPRRVAGGGEKEVPPPCLLRVPPQLRCRAWAGGERSSSRTRPPRAFAEPSARRAGSSAVPHMFSLRSAQLLQSCLVENMRACRRHSVCIYAIHFIHGYPCLYTDIRSPISSVLRGLLNG